MTTFEHKGVYHSALVQASDPGGLLVRFKSGPRESKYKGKPPFIAFEVSGDEGEYLYNIENGDIHSYLSHAPQDQWVMLHAAGSRDTAVVTLEDVHGNPAPLAPASNDGPPPNEWPEDTYTPKYAPQQRPDMVARFGEIYRGMCEQVGPAIGDATRAALVEAAQKIVVTEMIKK